MHVPEWVGRTMGQLDYYKSRTMIQGVSSDPVEDVTARTPIASMTVTYYPVLDIWFHMQVCIFHMLLLISKTLLLLLLFLLTNTLSWVSKQHKKKVSYCEGRQTLVQVPSRYPSLEIFQTQVVMALSIFWLWSSFCFEQGIADLKNSFPIYIFLPYLF